MAQQLLGFLGFVCGLVGQMFTAHETFILFCSQVVNKIIDICGLAHLWPSNCWVSENPDIHGIISKYGESVAHK